MTEFENIVVIPGAIPSLAITVILMIAVPVLFFVCWRRKHKPQTNIIWLTNGGTVPFVRFSE